MSSYPETIDVFADLDSTDNISSSDPNHTFESIENMQGFLGGMGKPQTWSETLLVVLKNYRRGMRVDNAGGTLYARTGEAVLISSDQNKTVFRRNAADVTIAAANIDAGTLIANEFYYVYAKGDSLATTAPIVFSSSSVQPDGIGTAPFVKLGWFKNKAAGALALTFAGSWRDNGDVPNAVIGSFTNNYTVAFTTYGDMTTAPFEVDFVSSGRPVEINANFVVGLANAVNFSARLVIDDVVKEERHGQQSSGSMAWLPFSFHWIDANVVAGTHVFKIQVYGTSCIIYGTGSSIGVTPRVITAKEL